MINLLKCSIQTELDLFFQILHHSDVPIRTLTKAAFTKARAKFRYQAFVELNQHLIQYFESHFPLRTWHGLRLLAIDGTTLTLPKNDDTLEHFDDLPTVSHHKRPMARASQLYDLLNRITLHASLAAYRVDERDLALSHGPYLRENDLILLDRGYPAFWLFAWILSESAHFCARVSLESWSVVREFQQSGRREQIVTIHSTHDSRLKCRLYGLSTSPIRVRLLRIPIPNEEDQILMTSLLDSTSFPYSLFLDLYHKRWGIEENFKHVKSRIGIENFTGKTVHSIYQDFHARIFSMNLTAVLVHPVQDDVDREVHANSHTQQVNFTYALSCMRHTIVRMFLQRHPIQLCRQLLNLFRRTLEPVRPHRSFPRNTVTRTHPVFFTCYKPTA